MKRFKKAGLIAALLSTPIVSLFAFEEGFYSLWLDQIPVFKIQNKYKVKLDPSELITKSHAVVRLEDTKQQLKATATFISHDGLLLTTSDMAYKCIKNFGKTARTIRSTECIDETCKHLVEKASEQKDNTSEEVRETPKAPEKEDPTATAKKEEIKAPLKMPVNPLRGYQAKELDDELHCDDFIATLLKDEKDLGEEADRWKWAYIDGAEAARKKQPKDTPPKETNPNKKDDQPKEEGQPENNQAKAAAKKDELTFELYQQLRLSNHLTWVLNYLDRIAFEENEDLEKIQDKAQEAIDKELYEEFATGKISQQTFQLNRMTRIPRAREEALARELFKEGVQPAILLEAMNLIRECEQMTDPKQSIKDYLTARESIPTRCDIREFTSPDGFQGLVLTKYEMIRDIRLVYVPSQYSNTQIYQDTQLAFINKLFPKVSFDFALFRVYGPKDRRLESGNKPYESGFYEPEMTQTSYSYSSLFQPNLTNLPIDSSKYFVRPDLTNSVKDGDFLYSFGHPKETQRWRTYPHAKFIHETKIPTILRFLELRKSNLWKLLVSKTGKRDSQSIAAKKELREMYREDESYVNAYIELVKQYDAKAALASLQSSWNRITSNADDQTKKDISIMNENFEVLSKYFAFYELSQNLTADSLASVVFQWVENIQNYQDNQKAIEMFKRILSSTDAEIQTSFDEEIKNADFLRRKDRDKYAKFKERAEKIEIDERTSDKIKALKDLSPKERFRKLLEFEIEYIYASSRNILFDQERIKTTVLNQPPGSAEHLGAVAFFGAVLEFAQEAKLPVFSEFYGDLKKGDGIKTAQKIFSHYPMIPFESLGDSIEVLQKGYDYYFENPKNGIKVNQEIIHFVKFATKLRAKVFELENAYGVAFKTLTEEVEQVEKNLRGLDRLGLRDYSNTYGFLRFSYGSVAKGKDSKATCTVQDFIDANDSKGFKALPEEQKKFCQEMSKFFGDVPVHFQSNVDALNKLDLQLLGVSGMRNVSYGQPAIDQEGLIRGIQVGTNWAAIGSSISFAHSKDGRSSYLSMPMIAQYIGKKDQNNRIFQELIYAANPTHITSFFESNSEGVSLFEEFKQATQSRQIIFDNQLRRAKGAADAQNARNRAQVERDIRMHFMIKAAEERRKKALEAVEKNQKEEANKDK